MDNKPLVSIVMPVYNSFRDYRTFGRPLLNQALDSLLSQSYRNFELIIIDSLSSDKTPEVLKEYALKDKRIKYVLDKEKMRAEEAIFFGCSLSKGKYLMVANDDDFWNSEYISKLVSYLEQNPDIDMAYANADFVDVDNNITCSSFLDAKDAYGEERSPMDNFCFYINKRNCLPIAFGIFRFEFYIKSTVKDPFDDLRANMDNLLMARLFLKGMKCHFINERLFSYRVRPRMLSDAPLIKGMPSLETPVLLWLYYVRHQLYFLNEIEKEIEESGFSFEQKILMKSSSRDSFLVHSANLLNWIKNDYMKDRKDYSRIMGLLEKNQVLKNIKSPYSYNGNDIRMHPLVLGKRIEECLVRIKSFGNAVSEIREKDKISSDIVELIKKEESEIIKEKDALDNLKKERPEILSENRQRSLAGHPKATVITMSYNTGKFLEDTMKSVQNQTYDNFEHLIIDGASTDGTLEMLKRYPFIRLVSEKDEGSYYAFKKGMAMAKGEYIFQCSISDGYLDKDWIKKCIEAMDANPDISLVWGLPEYMSEEGKLQEISYFQFHNEMPPQKQEYIYYWLSTNFWLPEGNFCVRKKVLEECFPEEPKEDMEPWFEFNYRFNESGYLPLFIPSVANFGRTHGNQLGQRNSSYKKQLKRYLKQIKLYKLKIIFGIKRHRYKDAKGNILPLIFSKKKFVGKYMFRTDSLVVNFKMFVSVRFGFLIRKMPRLYNFGKNLLNKITKS